MDIVTDRTTEWLNYVKVVSSTIEPLCHMELLPPSLIPFRVTAGQTNQINYTAFHSCFKMVNSLKSLNGSESQPKRSSRTFGSIGPKAATH
jgi:hypothetical protein